ncbi:MAG: hypothetical protein QOD69_1246 [Solirubrobacteraceae bacterium]|nr:hypothetical protein [Solirubrobacteraceae bacterium]
MLRNVVEEIVRRRLWPIPAVALVVAVAAPTLFLKAAPSGAPAAVPAAAAPAGGLPARAERLLAATGAEGSRGGATGAAQDPFQPPKSHHRAAAAAAAAAKKASTTSTAAPAAAAAPTEPVPVVIQNADGSAATPAATGDASAAVAGTTTTAPASTPSTATPAVDVRFGEQIDSPLHRGIPRLQPYFIHGKLAAMFVKYSPSLEKAVFAVAPGIAVTGPVKCRRVGGICRYLDIPAGSHAQLTMSASRTIVHRRLDVVRIDSTPTPDTTTAIAAKPGDENACLLHKLQAQAPTDAPVDRDACGSSK